MYAKRKKIQFLRLLSRSIPLFSRENKEEWTSSMLFRLFHSFQNRYKMEWNVQSNIIFVALQQFALRSSLFRLHFCFKCNLVQCFFIIFVPVSHFVRIFPLMVWMSPSPFTTIHPLLCMCEPITFVHHFNWHSSDMTLNKVSIEKNRNDVVRMPNPIFKLPLFHQSTQTIFTCSSFFCLFFLNYKHIVPA